MNKKPTQEMGKNQVGKPITIFITRKNKALSKMALLEKKKYIKIAIGINKVKEVP